MKISRNKGYQNKLKENYFEVIDTPLKAYFLGFLLTDGNVHNPKRKNRQSLIQIGLMLGDKYILEKFKNELDCDNKISEYNNGRRHECYFRMYSNKMANDLSKYGVVPNKTFLINNIPKVPQEYMPDLIRGIFDGDGTVYILKSNNKLRFGFYGTHNLVNSIVHYLNNLIDLPLNKITDKETVSFLTFGADRDIRNFYKYIYYNEDVFCLKRKREKFEKYI